MLRAEENRHLFHSRNEFSLEPIGGFFSLADSHFQSPLRGLPDRIYAPPVFQKKKLAPPDEGWPQPLGQYDRDDEGKCG